MPPDVLHTPPAAPRDPDEGSIIPLAPLESIDPAKDSAPAWPMPSAIEPIQPIPEPTRLTPKSSYTIPPRQNFFERYTLLFLLLITLFGGYIRFAWLDKPPLWTDEAYTYRRIATTYQDMLDVLEFDGFGPLSYEAYWTVNHQLYRLHTMEFW